MFDRVAAVAALASISNSPPVLEDIAKRIQSLSWSTPAALPVPGQLAAVLPEGGLRRGATVVVSGSTSLLLASLSKLSSGGSWCAIVNCPTLGVMAAAEQGVDLSRLILVPQPGDRWATVTAALLEAFEVVVVRPPEQVRSSDMRRLAARARECKAVLMPFVEHVRDGRQWEGADLRLHCDGVWWSGLENGHGYLRQQQLHVLVGGRRAASRQSDVLLSSAS